MNEQTLKHTHVLYDRFEELAIFVREKATEAEAMAFLEILSPLNNAIRNKLNNKPVAWRVKDYADGWILFENEKVAIKNAEYLGSALIEPLYNIPYIEMDGRPNNLACTNEAIRDFEKAIKDGTLPFNYMTDRVLRAAKAYAHIEIEEGNPNQSTLDF